MKECPNCHSSQPDNARFCPACGKRFTDNDLRQAQNEEDTVSDIPGESKENVSDSVLPKEAADKEENMGEFTKPRFEDETVQTTDNPDGVLRCSQCKSPVKPGARFCRKCGARIENVNNNDQQQNILNNPQYVQQGSVQNNPQYVQQGSVQNNPQYVQPQSDLQTYREQHQSVMQDPNYASNPMREENPGTKKKNRGPIIIIIILSAVIIALIGFVIYAKFFSDGNIPLFGAKNEAGSYESTEQKETKKEETEKEETEKEETEKEETKKGETKRNKPGKEETTADKKETHGTVNAATETAKTTEEETKAASLSQDYDNSRDITSVFTVSATSELPPAKDSTYYADNVKDNNLGTAWAEGEQGTGIGSQLMFQATDTVKVTGLDIYAGYQKSEDIYSRNGKPTQVNILFSNGKSENYNITNGMSGYTRIIFSNTVETSYISITITAAAAGSKFDDTSISEIKIFGYSDLAPAPTRAPTTTEALTESEEFVFPDSSIRYLTDADVRYLTQTQLRIARNEIYARHGRRFSDPELQQYFDSKYWYWGTINPDDFSESQLNAVEKANCQLIKKYETN